ncbi:MAG: FAD-dependent oxidoreductase [Spirochaetes bacterium]|nr:FAD-dependent oxidoreductase [Spirochaetota bacterium]
MRGKSFSGIARFLVLGIFALAIFAALSACSPGGQGRVALFTPGTFTATGEGGYGGDITLSVVFDAYSIVSIEIVSHNETAGFANIAFTTLIPSIIEAQSTHVDTVSGATYTSRAILDGVNNAIRLAGADPAALVAGAAGGAPVAPAPEVTVADLIVVGGGMGGLVTAISAAQNGASVIVIEKMPMLGGSTNFGGGLSVAGSRWQLEQGGLITADELYAGWIALEADDPRGAVFYDRSLIRPMVDRSGERFNWLLDLGYQVDLHPGGRMLQSAIPPGWDATMPAGGVHWRGPLLVEFLQNAALALGVHIHLNTRGTELVTNPAGAVTGVRASGAFGRVTFSANSAVVLATGGFSRNREMMQRFIPQLAPFVQHSTAAIGHMGDGMLMAEAVGAVPYPDPWLIGLGLQNEFSGMIIAAVPGILVNHLGNRFVMEARPPGFIDHYTYLYNFTIAYSPGGAFFVFDSSAAFQDRVAQVQANLASPSAFTGATVADLAAAMGVPAANLQAEIDGINAVVAGTAADRFGRTVQLNSITEPPFFAMRIYPMDMGTIGGVMVNEYYQVLDAQGQVIPGLFAVGEMSNRRYIAPMYFSGLSLMLTLQQGIVAGEAAAR